MKASLAKGGMYAVGDDYNYQNINDVLANIPFDQCQQIIGMLENKAFG